MKIKSKMILLMLFISLGPISALAENWSMTEIHFTNGNLTNPFSNSVDKSSTNIVTFQYVNDWDFGDSFVMFDYIFDGDNDGFNDNEIYHESYFNFSSKKILGVDYGTGAVKDIGVFAGINISADANVVKYLPGLRVSWDVPGFLFINTDAGFYIDDSKGVNKGGAPKQKNSKYFDISWAYPFSIGEQLFSLEGHVEYITGRTDETGGYASDWLLLQPQLRWDVGNILLSKKDKLFMGFEFQYWKNKLGVNGESDKLAQFLVVWRL
ncbi:nucleoside-binding protein [Bowmanella yangjiangensis]|uniref:Nucleoside-binding protein n=1 Tax=Bowmanella yangjiangensis TaxID=2811230 RepID=A0ABS3CTV4_9ALTE|nr:nucleoside-binding protein [Bowmanella yangjiangensis]MBN7819730.1 nucleoside-binding protein [Bowmanella yangjiangensis]